MRKLGLATAVVAVVLSVPSAAFGAVTSVLGGVVPCVAQPGTGVRICQGSPTALVPSFDGTPVDVNVVLPPAPASGADGGFPLIGVYHGWGGSKLTPTSTVAGRSLTAWAQAGYAMFSMSDRGWGDTCGGLSMTRTSAACLATGYNHLLDTRYEVRDAQTFIGMLADQPVSAGGPFLVDAQRIGTSGQSYGGGLSMQLAALKDRIMLPNGSYEPWVTPTTGRPLRIAAAAPEIPWSDLAYSLVPSGRTLDYANGPDYGDAVGVMKQSFVSGLYAVGEASSNSAAPMTDPQADVRTWYSLLTAGEPYTDVTKDILHEVQQHHSAFFIDHSEAPAPLLIANGFTDDLFPVDEAVRFRNRTKAQYPDAFVGLSDLDYGHARGQNKAADISRLNARQRGFLEYYLGGTGAQPTEDAQAMLQVCGTNAASPLFSAGNWAKLAPGEVRSFVGPAQTVASGGNAAAGEAFDPIAGTMAGGLGACATAKDVDVPSTAVVRIPVTGGGFTVLGSTTIIADVLSTSPNNQLAARLLDIGTDGNETLVARGLLRPRSTTGTIPKEEVFQLHPGAYKFAAGHTAKLELLSADTPYSRTSNGTTPIMVSNISLRIPVNEAPNGTTVKAPAQKVLPEGYTLAPDFGGRADTPVGGTTGPAGPAGATGPAGSNGSDGATGAAGTNGSNGATGATGTNGSNGATGAGGADGSNGPTGAAGTNGSNGSAGAAGTNGSNGATGAAGVDGTNGSAGTNGTNGSAGTNGTNGGAGSNGATGAGGTNGTNGTNGAGGTNGTNGRDGVGVPGPAGPAGPAGATAKSAARRVATCSMRRGAKATAVTCRVRLASAAARVVRVRLTRGGQVLATGTGRLRSGTTTFRLRGAKGMASGRYRLRVLAGSRTLASVIVTVGRAA